MVANFFKGSAFEDKLVDANIVSDSLPFPYTKNRKHKQGTNTGDVFSHTHRETAHKRKTDVAPEHPVRSLQSRIAGLSHWHDTGDECAPLQGTS